MRVVAVTRDSELVSSLRRDGLVDVVAEVRDAAVAGALLASVPVDALFVDEDQAAEVSAMLRDSRGSGVGAANLAAGGPAVYVLRATPAPPAAKAGCGGFPRPSGPIVLDYTAGDGRELAEKLGQARDQRPARDPRPTGDLTLRDWWLASQAGGGVLPVEAALPGRGVSPGAVRGPRAAPEVLMRQLITVVSPKGGVGKTFVSVNLAAGLARHTGFRVLLLDLDLHSGDAAVHLNLIGSPTLAELSPYAGNLDPGHLDRAVVTHPASRLDVLLAPSRPEAAEMVTREHLGSLLRLVRQRYDFALIDTPPDPSDPLVAECLGEATAIVLVSTLDAAALRQCRLFLDTLAAGEGDLRQRLVVVLNQVHGGGPVEPARAAAFLGASAGAGAGGPGAGEVRAFVVPEDRAASERAVFDGRPLVLTSPGHPVSRAIFEVADVFCPVFGGLAAEARPRRSGLGRLVEAFRRL